MQQPLSLLRDCLIIIKVGGSAFTDKRRGIDKLESASTAIADEIAASGVLNREKLVVIHGAGYFLHRFAKTKRLSKYRKGSETDFAKLANMALEVSLKLSSKLASRSIPVLTLSTRSLCRMAGGRLLINDWVIKGFSDLGYVPLLSSDAPLSTRSGMEVVSGDAIAAGLSRTLKAKRVIFVTDVDGVLDPDGKVIGEIAKRDIGHMKLLERRVNDVTGGMHSKLALTRSMRGDVFIISLRKKGNLAKALQGTCEGTIIR